MSYWLMKSEPGEFSIDDLRAAKGRVDHWDGVRNYQARNYLRAMSKGDLAFFYHSNCAQPGIVGVMRIHRAAYPDHTAFDPRDHHFDPKSDADNPRWFMVDVKYVRKLKRTISLAQLRGYADRQLKGFPLLKRGNRLSVIPVEKRQWDFILGLE